MASISFSDFVTLLPSSPEDTFKSKQLPVGLSYVRENNPCFVEPDLAIEEPVVANETSIVLLASPGAVGKSTLASELAHRTGATLWDLSQVQVGSRTFAGTIMEAFSFVATGVSKRVRQGEFLFVLDALDEAQVRAGSQNFDAFLSDLADTLQYPREKPVVVLLARTDTADWINLVLEESRVPLARLQIEYFDEQRALSFIDKRLDYRRESRGDQLLHRQQRVPYEEARNALVGLVYSLFNVTADEAWNQKRVRDFLGYAPVLEALADYLYVNNYLALVQELNSEACISTNDQWHFLADIVNHLLKREQGKIQTAIRANLEPAAKRIGWSDWNTLYSPDEQCARVLGKAINMSAVNSPQGLPSSLAERYEDALTTMLLQHPFLGGHGFANVVFKEYLYAWGIARSEHSIAESLRVSMRSLESPFLPSQLFGRFMVHIGGEDTTIIDGQDFGVVYESLLSRTDIVDLTIQGTTEEIQASVFLGGERSGEVNFQIFDSGSGIHFWRRLICANVDVGCTVRLGLEGQRFALGPAVDLDCDLFVTQCIELDIDVKDSVTLKAGKYSAVTHPLKLRIRNESKGALVVSWPSVSHPWAAYRGTSSQSTLALSDSLRSDALRKFILMFRRQRTRMERTLINARWSPEQRRERDSLLELALRRNVLRRIGGHNAFEFNNDFASLRSLVLGRPEDLSDEAKRFVVDYLQNS